MKVFVTGGTGAVGRFVVPALVAEGHDVTVLARGAEKAAQVERQGGVPTQVDLFDPDGLATAVAGHQAVLNLATAIPPMRKMDQSDAWAANIRIRTEGSANLVEAALRGGVDRFVQESIAFTYGDRGDNWIDEDTPLETAGLTDVTTAEANARRFAESRPGNVAVVLRFGWFYGPGSEQTASLVAAARGQAGPRFGPRDHWVGSLHFEDAAAAAVAALDARDGTYNVSDDPVTWGEFAEALGRAVGEAPWLRVPERLASVFGDRAETLYRSQRVSNRRFREATGWASRYPSVREGWPAVVRAMEGGTG